MAPAAAFGPVPLAARLAALIASFPDARVAVAFSGGGDSLALLAAIATVARRRPRLALRALHVDHGLDAASGHWARRCRALAGAQGVRFGVRRVAVAAGPGESLEAAARTARYAAFARALAPGECLLTAHHLDDQAETVLLQLLRGAGVAGLAAMPARAPLGRGWLLRPLLDVPRAALRDYARRRRLEWIEDPMNADPRFDRVFVRQAVLPPLLGRWPGAVRALARSACHAAEAQRLLAGLAATDLATAAEGADLAVTALRRLTPERRRNAVRYWVARHGGRMPDARRLAEVCGPLLAARRDARPAVWWEGGGVQRIAGQRLVWRRAPEVAPPAGDGVDWAWRERSMLWLPGARGRLELRGDAHGDIDLAALPATVAVRWRRGGERLRPRAGGPARTVKRLLQEARVAAWERAALPLVFSGTQLLAVADRWTDASVQAGAGTAARARLVWHRTPRRARPGEADLVT
ncbi:MAG: tRNA lysidine(34) synthetase TilS [Steroidobacteraceae bacterium]